MAARTLYNADGSFWVNIHRQPKHLLKGEYPETQIRIASGGRLVVDTQRPPNAFKLSPISAPGPYTPTDVEPVNGKNLMRDPLGDERFYRVDDERAIDMNCDWYELELLCTKVEMVTSLQPDDSESTIQMSKGSNGERAKYEITLDDGIRGVTREGYHTTGRSVTTVSYDRGHHHNNESRTGSRHRKRVNQRSSHHTKRYHQPPIRDSSYITDARFSTMDDAALLLVNTSSYTNPVRTRTVFGGAMGTSTVTPTNSVVFGAPRPPIKTTIVTKAPISSPFTPKEPLIEDARKHIQLSRDGSVHITGTRTVVPPPPKATGGAKQTKNPMEYSSELRRSLNRSAANKIPGVRTSPTPVRRDVTHSSSSASSSSSSYSSISTSSALPPSSAAHAKSNEGVNAAAHNQTTHVVSQVLYSSSAKITNPTMDSVSSLETSSRTGSYSTVSGSTITASHPWHSSNLTPSMTRALPKMITRTVDEPRTTRVTTLTAPSNTSSMASMPNQTHPPHYPNHAMYIPPIPVNYAKPHESHHHDDNDSSYTYESYTTEQDSSTQQKLINAAPSPRNAPTIECSTHTSSHSHKASTALLGYQFKAPTDRDMRPRYGSDVASTINPKLVRGRHMSRNGRASCCVPGRGESFDDFLLDRELIEAIQFGEIETYRGESDFTSVSGSVVKRLLAEQGY